MENSEKKILLVDDEPAILDLFKNYLNIDRQLYGVMTAGNVQDAVGILAREKISLVVSDIKMPGISGLDLLAIIRSRYPGTKVILITGRIAAHTGKRGENHYSKTGYLYDSRTAGAAYP